MTENSNQQPKIIRINLIKVINNYLVNAFLNIIFIILFALSLSYFIPILFPSLTFTLINYIILLSLSVISMRFIANFGHYFYVLYTLPHYLILLIAFFFL